MTSTAPVLASNAHRPLLMKRRADLVVRSQTYQGRNYWVVKDPLSLKYYRFEEEEYAILEMLDGRSSLAEIRDRFEQRFAPQKLALRELHRLVGMLHQSSLVVADTPGQGAQLLDRQRTAARRAWWARLANPLSIRFAGLDPDRLLSWLERRIGWFFSFPWVLFVLGLAASALLLVGTRWDEFQEKLPALRDFFASPNWPWLAVALGVTKVLHELGHGIACKRLGGECHEMGVMFLVFTPCLYCNVSDSWLLPNKWHRAAIGAAGMYVELALASLATFLWWSSEPGLLHFLAFNTLIVCSVSTLLFNANPLLRYDGYYILSDLVEVPNLRQKADWMLQRRVLAWTAGIPERDDPFLPRRGAGFFSLYAIAAFGYRWMVSLAIVWFLERALEPYGLRVLGQALAALVLTGMIVQPLGWFVRSVRNSGRVDQVSAWRLVTSSVISGLVLGAAWTIPLPFAVRCSLYLQPRDAATVYVDVPGSLVEIGVRPGDWVDQGQGLLRLENLNIQLELTRLRSESRRLQARLTSLRQRAFDDEQAGREISETEEALRSLEEQLAAREEDERRLAIVAPAAGVVFPPATVPPAAADGARLPIWSGTPLDARNLRATLAEGVPVCQIGDPNQLEAVLLVDERDVEFLRPGQTVELFLEQTPGQPIQTQIRQLAQMDTKIAPRSLSSQAGGELLSRVDSSGQVRPLHATYQASAPLRDESGLLVIGATGRARIQAHPQTIAQRVWRYLCHTFRFDA